MPDKKTKETIRVKARPEFMSRRFKTLKLSDKKLYRTLKTGESVVIPKSEYEKDLYQEVKHGNK